MSAMSVEVPYPVFTARDGEPLEDGYVWIGVANLNPQTNPIQVYFDRNLTQLAAQPLRTINGYISNAGTPSQIYIDGNNYSILVHDKKGTMVYNFPDGTGIAPLPNNVCGTSYLAPFPNTVTRPTCEKLGESVSVKDFGAVGDGVADDTAAIQAAINSGATIINLLSNETYLVTQLNILTNLEIRGDKTSTLLWSPDTGTNSFIILSGNPTVRFFGFTINSNRQSHIDTSGFYAAVEGLLDNGAEIDIDSVSFINGRIIDVRITGPVLSNEQATVRISNCSFTNGLRATSETRGPKSVQLTYAVNAFINNNFFSVEASDGISTFGRAGVTFQNPAAANVAAFGSIYASGNRFINIGKSPNNLGCIYIYSGARGVRIIGNYAENPRGSAFAAKADQGEIVIADNTVNNQVGTVGFCFGIYGQGDITNISVASSLSITGNTVNNAEASGVFVEGLLQTGIIFKNVNISNNVINSCLRGVYIRRIENVIVSNNVINDCTVGIFSPGGLEGPVLINGNTIVGGEISSLFNDSIDTLTNSDFAYVSNILKNPSARGLRFLSQIQNAVIQNNVLIDVPIAFEFSGASGIISATNNTLQNVITNLIKSGSYSAFNWGNNISPALPLSVRNVTISNGEIIVSASYHLVAGENGVNDDLNTLNGGFPDQIVTLSPALDAVTITVKSGIGNLFLDGGADFVMDNSRDTITLLKSGTNWIEISRSNNGT